MPQHRLATAPTEFRQLSRRQWPFGQQSEDAYTSLPAGCSSLGQWLRKIPDADIHPAHGSRLRNATSTKTMAAPSVMPTAITNAQSLPLIAGSLVAARIQE